LFVDAVQISPQLVGALKRPADMDSEGDATLKRLKEESDVKKEVKQEGD
jgi:hypothetical protein